ncbi:MAG: hypothetical protein FGM24_03710 [Candidatus Kapabacteria bacterium]|nr:hypothetical protein [Candidatus Kapabacteria bacterium]
MLLMLRVELSKVFSKWRTFIGFIALGLLVPIIVVAMRAEGVSYFAFATQAVKDVFEFRGNLLNGYTVALIIMSTMFVHVPFLATLVAGDMLAGEATGGTYRLVFTRPVKRSTVVTAKWIASMLTTLMLIAWLALLSFGLGIPLLGTGEVVNIRSMITVLAADDVLWRFAWAYGIASLGMMTVSSVAFLLSSLVENAIGPIMTTMAILIVFTIISAIDLPIFGTLRPLFFTNHMIAWRFMFDDPVPWARIYTSIGVLVGHIITCFIATQIIIRRKDILT